jgi:hypothetical protein
MENIEVLKTEVLRLQQTIAMRNRQIKDLRRLIKNLRGEKI